MAKTIYYNYAHTEIINRHLYDGIFLQFLARAIFHVDVMIYIIHERRDLKKSRIIIATLFK